MFLGCILVAVTSFLMLPDVDGTATLKVKMVRYDSKERNWDGTHCDILKGDCDPMFRFCLSKSAGIFTACNLCAQCNQITTTAYDGTNVVTFSTSIKGIQNPIVVSLDAWPGSFKLYVYVKDSDGGWTSSDHMDTFQNTISGARKKTSTESMYSQTLSGTRSTYKSQLSIQWYAYCDTNFYGSACDVYCVAENGPGGHYSCDSNTGAKVCLSGWETPTENCNVKVNDCENHQCINGATCVDQYKKYTCSCRNQYTGDKCQTLIDECTSQPCQNGAACVVGVNKYTCNCVAGYGGVNCETDINECSSTPCLNGAQCNNNVNYYTCTCVGGYYGPKCENKDACFNNSQCLNGGTCKNAGNDFVCACTNTHWGTFCQVEKKCLTQSIVCQNGGTCIDGITGEWLCKCTGDYTGTHCQFDNPCLPNPCAHGQCTIGAANSVQGIVACTCDVGWVGDKCDMDDPCLPNPCRNEGRCVHTSYTTYRCECACDYMGADCTVLSPCYTNPCKNGGNCSVTSSLVNGATVFNPSCSCLPNYGGNLCQNGFCELQSPCTGGATCTSLIKQEEGSYTCTGGTSNTCAVTTTVLDTCVSSPCENGGTCTNKNDAYICMCKPGYSGLNCHINTDECSPNPCNQGNCTDLLNGYACTCSAQYFGEHCENLNECYGNTACQNNATCVDVDNDYMCMCTAGFLGRHCEFELKCQTQANPCQNGGSCINDVTSGQHRCLCPSQFLGNNCEIDNPCDPNPCIDNTECIVKDAPTKDIACKQSNGTICGYTFHQSPCDPNPCQNNGGCSANGTGYVCTCDCGYYGTHCEVSNPCTNFGCENSATCLVNVVTVNGTNSTAGVTTYQPSCNCLTGFSGDKCELGPCSIYNPCGVHGTCVDTVMAIHASYYCNCATGWQGNNCTVSTQNSSLSGFNHQTGSADSASTSSSNANTGAAAAFAVIGGATAAGAVTFYVVKKKRSSSPSSEDNNSPTTDDSNNGGNGAAPTPLPDSTGSMPVASE